MQDYRIMEDHGVMEDHESKDGSLPPTDEYQPANEELVATNISTRPDEASRDVTTNPPEGGLIAWLAVLTFFLTIMNTWYFPPPFSPATSLTTSSGE
jgi:hypothetical protein